MYIIDFGSCVEVEELLRLNNQTLRPTGIWTLVPRQAKQSVRNTIGPYFEDDVYSLGFIW